MASKKKTTAVAPAKALADKTPPEVNEGGAAVEAAPSAPQKKKGDLSALIAEVEALRGLGDPAGDRKLIDLVLALARR